MRRTILVTALLTSAIASLPVDGLACECWWMRVVGTTMEASFAPTLDASNFQGFVIDRSIPEFCDTLPEVRITPVPLAFGETHTISLPPLEAGWSVRYRMKTVHADGRERSPVDLCDFPPECLGLVPPVTYVPGTLGMFLGHGILSGNPAGNRFSFDPCTPGCGPDCSLVIAADELIQTELSAIAQAGTPHLFWGSYDLQSDYCFTQITRAVPAACTVGVETRSWGTLKGWFD